MHEQRAVASAERSTTIRLLTKMQCIFRTFMRECGISKERAHLLHVSLHDPNVNYTLYVSCGLQRHACHSTGAGIPVQAHLCALER